MSDNNRDEILSTFQGCTGIDDVGEAMMWLENSEWDLLTAVKNALPQETQTLPSDAGSSNVQPDATELSNGVPASFSTDFTSVPASFSSDFTNPPTTSRKRPMKTIDFNILYQDKLLKMQVSDLTTVAMLKSMILKKTGVPPCQQRLTGWETLPPEDDVKIRTLGLPRDHVLSLEAQNAMEMDVGGCEETVYTFHVLDETSGNHHRVTEPGNKTIQYIKLKVEKLTGIPICQQLWDGWPSGSLEECPLYQCRLSLPYHDLTVKDARVKEVIEIMDSDSSPDEYEDASETLTAEDEMFEEDHAPRRTETLIPDNVEDEISGAIHFTDRFSSRYGDLRPAFYQGSLEDAIKEACLKPAKERKLLAIYLHHDRSVLSNVFCTELLCFDSVLQTLEDYFVVWGWDITHESNRNQLLQSVARSLGPPVADTISLIQVDSLPSLIIITRSRSNTELFNVINGNVGVNELLTMLIHAVDVYTEMQKAEMVEEEERNKREKIKTEQDKAYEQSLLLDMAKEEAKKKQEQLAHEERQRIAREMKEKEEKILAERQAVKSKLPAEPEVTDARTTVKIRFRCPKGSTMERRFLLTDTLQVIFNYLLVEGFKTDDYKIILSWPKRDLTVMNPKSTLCDIKLHPQETIILEER